jgi:hypothetical protein
MTQMNTSPSLIESLARRPGTAWRTLWFASSCTASGNPTKRMQYNYNRNKETYG